MQLHELKTHPVIKFALYIMFTFVIISFVFAYGWNASSMQADQIEGSLARYETDDPLSFIPGRDYEYISAGEVKSARRMIIDRKLFLLPLQVRNAVYQSYALGQDPLQWMIDEGEDVEEAMNQRILQEEAHRLGLFVSREKIREFLRENYADNRVGLDNMLDAMGLSLEEYELQLMAERETRMMRNALASEGRFSIENLWNEYVFENEGFTFRIGAYRFHPFADEMEATEQQMTEYLAEKGESLRVPPQRRYAFVKIDRNEMGDALEVVEADLESYYNSNAAKYTRPPAIRADDIFVPRTMDQQTTRGIELATMIRDKALASEGSWADRVEAFRKENPEAMVYHRDTTWVEDTEESRNLFGPQFVERMFTLADDQISTPIATMSGVHLLQIADRRPAGLPPLEEVRDKVEQDYRDFKGREMFEQERLRLSAEVRKYTSIKDFAKVIGAEDELTTRIQSTNYVIPEIANLNEHANYLRGLRLNQLSEVIPSPGSDPNLLIVMQIVEERDSHIPTIEEGREKLLEEVQRLNAKEHVRRLCVDAFERIKAGESFDDFFQDASYPPFTTGPHRRKDTIPKLSYGLVDFSKQSARLREGSLGVIAFGPSEELLQGYLVYQVLAITPPSREDFLAGLDMFRRMPLESLTWAMAEEALSDMRRERGFETMVDLDLPR